MTDTPFHPLADAFPLLEGEQFRALVADIRKTGLITPIIQYQDLILDGRNRYRACREAQIEPRFEQYSGTDPLALVISANVRRRHLDESQRAMVAAKLANTRQGERTDLSPIGERLVSQERAAELLRVGKRTVERAVQVRDNAVPELAHKVECGEISVSVAADVARLPEAEQREIVARGKKVILQAARRIRSEKIEQRRTERLAKIVAIPSGNTMLPTDKYSVIYADPPWKHRVWSELGEEHGGETHSPGMVLTDICALPVHALAAEDAVLFMWVPDPLLFSAKNVLDAWGFMYKTHFVWRADEIASGQYNRTQHEILLVATRGKIGAPAQGDRPPSVIEAPRGPHGAKPDEFAALIDRMFPPPLRRVELFAHTRRPEWDAWGNQAPVVPQPDASDVSPDQEAA